MGFCTALLLGFGIPKLNQHLTRALLQREQDKQAQERSGQPQPTPPASGLPPVSRAVSGSPFSSPLANSGAFLPNPFQHIGKAGFNPQALTSALNANWKPGFPQAFHLSQAVQARHAAQPVQFGGGAELASSILQKLNQNDQLSTLFFSDLPLSTGRAATTRNYDEFLEKTFKEAAIILTLFCVMPYAEKWLSGMRQDVGFHGMKYLRDRYRGDGARFKADYFKLQQALNLEGKPLTSHIPDAKDTKAVSAVVEQIRSHFHMNRAAHHGDNLLYAMAEANGKIPTLKVNAPSAKAAVKHIDITRQIDLDGVRAIAAFLDTLAQAEGKNAFQNELTRQALKKTGAFAGATMIGFGLMSYLIPKVQHYITYKRTGKDYFPGVQPEVSERMTPAPSMLAAGG